MNGNNQNNEVENIEHSKAFLKDIRSIEKKEELIKSKIIEKHYRIPEDLLKTIDICDPKLLEEFLKLPKNKKYSVDQIVSIMKSHEQNIELLKSFILINPTFQSIYENLSESFIDYLCNYFKLIQITKSTTLIKYMWNSESYYIILAGQVMVKSPINFIKKFNNSDEANSYLNSNRDNIIKKELLTNQKIIQYKFTFLEEILELGQFDGFCDFSLDNRKNM